MKSFKALINKIRNLCFNISIFLDRKKDGLREKTRKLKVRLKKIDWIYTLSKIKRTTLYKIKNSKVCINLNNKINIILDKIFTDKLKAMIRKIKRNTPIKIAFRTCIVGIVAVLTFSLISKTNSSSTSMASEYSKLEEQVVAHAGAVNDNVEQEEIVVGQSSAPINDKVTVPSVVPTTPPAPTVAPVVDANETKESIYVPFVSNEDNTPWLEDARVNNYNEANYFDYKGYKFYKDENIDKSYIGIDVSSYQGDIDWAKVKASGVSFVMIRVGYRGYVSGKLMYDSKFVQNIVGATKQGLNVGLYFFSQAINEQEAIEEADFITKAIKKCNITMPIAFDGEHVPDSLARTNIAKLDNKKRTDICIAFCERIKQSGYVPIIYDNNSHLLGGFQLSRLNSYYVWYARYADLPGYKYGYEMWQYTEDGKVPGIKGGVDLNICNVDFPTIIKYTKLNKIE